jgi:hypothetical protein
MSDSFDPPEHGSDVPEARGNEQEGLLRGRPTCGPSSHTPRAGASRRAAGRR